MNTQTTQIEMPIMAETSMTSITIQANTFYAIADETNNGAYSIVKVVKSMNDKVDKKLKVCQFAHVFNKLPTVIYSEELGLATAQFCLDKSLFLSWQPIQIIVIESYFAIEDELDWTI